VVRSIIFKKNTCPDFSSLSGKYRENQKIIAEVRDSNSNGA